MFVLINGGGIGKNVKKTEWKNLIVVVVPLKGRSSDTLVIPRYWQLDGLLSCVVCVCASRAHTWSSRSHD